MGIIKVGTCGWSIKGGRKNYFKVFKLIEIQQTFYKLPRVETSRKWRMEAPQDFDYTMKAWQVVTHPPSAPSWRRAGLKIDASARDKYGFLKPTEENLKAWEETLEVAKGLKASVIVVQTPPSFGFSEENVKNVETFFSTVKRNGIDLGWEPRGTWNSHLDVVKKLVDSLDIIHIVDVLRRDSVSAHDVAYFRLHGLGGKEVNYRYKYTDEDLELLLNKVRRYAEEKSLVYILFNNVFMGEDAQRFKALAKAKGLEVI
ncbi:MAG: DUF72 domain-containing protein [Thermoprotei archaeon]|nr:MAG: DUF72 domain-containing protein [Thermoprotei archaeon]